MNTQDITSMTKTILIDGVSDLDPIVVNLFDISKGQGMITISCYDLAMTHYWGATGSRNVAEFFVSCNTPYLVGKLSKVKEQTDDYEALHGILLEALKEQRDLMGWQRARDIEWLLTDDESIFSDDDDAKGWVNDNNGVLIDLLGEDWIYQIPQKENPDYVYMVKIIDTVKESLKGRIAEGLI